MNNIGGLKHKMAWVRYIVWYRLCISNNTYSRKTRLVIKIRLIVFEDWIQNIRVQLYHCKLSLIVMIHTCSINKKKKLNAWAWLNVYGKLRYIGKSYHTICLTWLFYYCESYLKNARYETSRYTSRRGY